MELFENIQLENGIILGLILLIISYVPMLFGGKAVKRLISFDWMKKREKFLSFILLVLFLGNIILPAFMKISENAWQLVFGYFFFGAGLLGILQSYRDYFTSASNKLITKGIYKFSRNPIYVSTLLMILGMVILLNSLILAVIFVLYIILQHPIILEEERYCMDTYKDDYLEYKYHTRRYF